MLEKRNEIFTLIKPKLSGGKTGFRRTFVIFTDPVADPDLQLRGGALLKA